MQDISLSFNNLTGWDLSGQNLANANLNQSRLTNANLTGANLAEATLVATTLTNANLAGANFANAFLLATTLIDADLTGANLRNAILAEANLTNAIFSAGTVYNQWTAFPDGFNPKAEGLTFIMSAAGDFDGIDGLAVTDVDLLSEWIRTGCNDLLRSNCTYGFALFDMFNLNNDTVIDQEDLRIWVEDLKGAHFGDADLDGNVSFPDFLALADHFDGPGGWGQGDFDADGSVQFSDFLLLAHNYGSTATTVAAAVPEPSSASLLIIGVLLLGRPAFSRRKRT